MKLTRSLTAISSECSSCFSGYSLKEKINYTRIKYGLRKSIPAAIVLWAFHQMPDKNGLTSKRVIHFLKQHYKVVHDPRKTGKSISTMMRRAVEFGLLKRRGNKYFLPQKA